MPARRSRRGRRLFLRRWGRARDASVVSTRAARGPLVTRPDAIAARVCVGLIVRSDERGGEGLPHRDESRSDVDRPVRSSRLIHTPGISEIRRRSDVVKDALGDVQPAAVSGSFAAGVGNESRVRLVGTDLLSRDDELALHLEQLERSGDEVVVDVGQDSQCQASLAQAAERRNRIRKRRPPREAVGQERPAGCRNGPVEPLSDLPGGFLEHVAIGPELARLNGRLDLLVKVEDLAPLDASAQLTGRPIERPGDSTAPVDQGAVAVEGQDVVWRRHVPYCRSSGGSGASGKVRTLSGNGRPSGIRASARGGSMRRCSGMTPAHTSSA